MPVRAFSFVLLAVALASCEPTAETPTPPPAAGAASTPPASPAPSASPSLAPIASLAGEWRVAGIDGGGFDEPVGIALSGDGDELWWEPRCAGLVRAYRITGTTVSFFPSGERAALPPGSPPPPVCAIAVPTGIDQVSRALDSATTVGRTSANGVQISGGGQSVLLFSQ